MKQVVPVAALLLSSAALAQSAPTSANPLKNVVRLDFAGPFFLTLGYNVLRPDTYVVLPVLLGYERQLGSSRLSANVEVLLNGGTPGDKRVGLAVQGRYYVVPARQTNLMGLYVAPTCGYRAIRRDEPYGPAGTDKLLGGGVLVGTQLPLGAAKGLVLDAAIGAMSWALLNEGEVAQRTHSYYQQAAVLPDCRLSLGYRF